MVQLSHTHSSNINRYLMAITAVNSAKPMKNRLTPIGHNNTKKTNVTIQLVTLNNGDSLKQQPLRAANFIQTRLVSVKSMNKPV